MDSLQSEWFRHTLRFLHVDNRRRATSSTQLAGSAPCGTPGRRTPAESAPGALLGRSRAEILLALDVPRTTTELAVLLGAILRIGQPAPHASATTQSSCASSAITESS